jgi:membrane-bound metal-dependent hydrolase YbcI (DUF457 family)
MPSTLVHLALGALIAAALLEDAFGPRALAVVLAAVALPDLDTFVGIVLPGTHRAALHTILVPLLAAAAIAYDLRRENSWLRARGERTVRIAWVAVLAYVVAGIGPDLFFNGVNILYPLHDRFYELNGRVLVSNQRGLVQTFWEAAESTGGTTENTHYRTGADVARGEDPANAERVFPIATSGLQMLLLLAATVVTGARLWLDRQ